MPDDTDIRQAVRDLQDDAGLGLTPQRDPIAESVAASGGEQTPAIATTPTPPQGSPFPAYVTDPWPESVFEALKADDDDWAPTAMGGPATPYDPLADPMAPQALERHLVYVSTTDYEANFLGSKLADVTDDATYLGVAWDIVTAAGIQTIRPLITKADIDDKYVEVSANDTTPGNIEAKLVGETASDRTTVCFVTNDDGGNETRGLYIDHADLPTNALLDGAVHSDTTASAPTQGDIVFGNASTPSAWDDLPLGETGQILTPVAGELEWAALGDIAGGTDVLVAVCSGDTGGYLEDKLTGHDPWIAITSDGTIPVAITHAGPGASCCAATCSALMGIFGFAMDEFGHIRYIQVCGSAEWSDGDCVGPCGCVA